jgi:uncharacterized membrane protein YdjX (TVP38/TMEM64 family)
LKRLKKRIYIGGAIALGLGVMAVVGGVDSRSLDLLYAHTKELDIFIAQHPIVAAVAMIGIYWAILAIGLPGASLLNVVCGYFFGMIDGALIAIVGLMGSAAFTYWLGRTYVYRWLYRKHPDKVGLVKAEVDENGPFYVLAVRLSTIFPFFWVNLLFGASGLRWRHYVWPTLLGLIPGAGLFLHVGSTLASLDSLSAILSPKMVSLFIGLGILALLPVLLRRFFKTK